MNDYTSNNEEYAPDSSTFTVDVRPISNGYVEALWIRHACRETNAQLDIHAFRHGTLASHGVVGTIRHGFWEFVALLSNGRELQRQQILQHIYDAMLERQDAKAFHFSTLTSPSGVDRYFFDSSPWCSPHPASLDRTLNRSFVPASIAAATYDSPKPIPWPFPRRSTSPPPEVNNDRDSGKRTLFVGARLDAPDAFGCTEQAAAELIAHFWDDSVANPVLCSLRERGIVYSSIAAYSRESCSLNIGLLVPDSANAIAQEYVEALMDRPLTPSELGMAKDRARWAICYGGPANKAVRDTAILLEHGSSQGILAALDAVTEDDCRQVLRWTHYSLVSEALEFA